MRTLNATPGLQASARTGMPPRPAPVFPPAQPLGNRRTGLLIQRVCAEEERRGKIHRRALAVSQPGDPFEQEADRVAGQLMRMGGSHRPTEFLRRVEGGSPPATVDAAIRQGGGQPLERAERAFFEPRLGHDLGPVRIRADGQAAQAAAAVNARAFTVGANIYFGADEYRPGTGEGRRLLAHELVHVVQQLGGGRMLQRFVSCGTADDCPSRNRGEVRRSQSAPHEVETYQPTTFGLLVANFAVGSPNVKPDFAGNPAWLAVSTRIGGAAREEWEVLGFSDCQGTEPRNRTLRQERASAIAALLPRVVAAGGRVSGAPYTDCIASNLSETGRNKNRSVLVRRRRGATGPTVPPWTAGRVGPVRPPRSPGAFCVPYTNTIEATAARLWLETSWLSFARARFGVEVHDLWRDYLNRPKGASLAPRVFRGRPHPIVDAFRTDPQTMLHRRLLFADIQARAARTPETNVPFTGTRYVSPPIPLATLLPAASLLRTINYTDPDRRIPGNIAGGTGVIGTASSDAGPDLRVFRGNVRIERARPGPGAPEAKTARIELQLQVIDAIDFCPGAAGGTVAQMFTIPMSRLEATPTEPTYDLPFHVFVDLDGNVPLP